METNIGNLKSNESQQLNAKKDCGNWLPLFLADQVNLIEGMANKLKDKFSSLLTGKSWKEEWKHNRKGVTAKVVTAVAVAGLIMVVLKRKK